MLLSSSTTTAIFSSDETFAAPEPAQSRCRFVKRPAGPIAATHGFVGELNQPPFRQKRLAASGSQWMGLLDECLSHVNEAFR